MNIREAFEAWVKDNNYCYNLDKFKGNGIWYYEYMSTDRIYEAFVAGYELCSN